MPPFGAKHADSAELFTVPRRWVRRRRRRHALRKALKKFAKRNNLVAPTYHNYVRRTRLFIRGDFVGDYNRFVVTHMVPSLPVINIRRSEFRAIIELEKEAMLPRAQRRIANNPDSRRSNSARVNNNVNNRNDERRVPPVFFPLNILRSHRTERE